MQSLKPTEINVLFVDDTESVRMLYGRILSAEGYNVTLAEDGERALASLATQKADIVILDYMMPGLNGEEVLQKIRRDPKHAHTPVIYLTASVGDEAVIERAYGLGLDDYLTKPLDRRILLARVKSVVEGKRARTFVESTSRDNAELLGEMARARDVQLAQLPSTPSRVENWVVTGALEPCFHVGGDIFDIIDSPDGTRSVVLVDVSGHGLGAAMVASATRSMLRLLLRTYAPEMAMSELNRQLCLSNDGHYACVGVVQVSGDDVRVVNAGLPPIALVRGGEIAMTVEGSGTPPGLFDEGTYTTESFVVGPGDRILLASDGLTEPFGSPDDVGAYAKRLALLDRRGTFVGGGLKERLQKLVHDEPATHADDATVVVIERID